MKRKMILAAIVMMVVALTGCRDGNALVEEKEKGEKENNQKVEITYYTWGDEEAYMSGLIDAFNAQSESTHVNATYIPSTGTEYDEKIISLLSSNSDMDLFSASNVKELIKYRDAGSLADITDAIRSGNLDVEKYGTSFLETKKDDRFYGLPYRYSTMALFYNKRIFDKENIPYPEKLSWEEYATLAKKLTKVKEDGTKQWGGFLPDWFGEPLLAVQRGSSVMDPDTSALKEWLALMGRFYIEDKSHMSFEEMKSTSTDWIKIFLAGDVAMIPNGEWTIGNTLQEIKANPEGVGDFELGVTYLPLPEGIDEPIAVGGPNTFIMINKNSDNFSNAYEFAEFLCGFEGAKYLVNAGMLPAYIDDEIVKLYTETVGVTGVEKMLETDTRYECDPSVDFSKVDTIWREEKELYLIGEETLEESMSNFEQRRAEVIK